VTGLRAGGSTVVAADDAGPLLVLLSLLDEPMEELPVLEFGPASFLAGDCACDWDDGVELLV